MNDEHLKAIENIKYAVDVNDGDTLSRLSEDGKVLWIASGSWEGSKNVTLGDLRAIARIGTAKLPSAEEFRSYVIGSEQASMPLPTDPGEVDSPEFRKLCIAYYSSDAPWRIGRHDQLIAHIADWGAQQRERGRKEATETAMQVLVQGQEWRRRAEKAEARADQLSSDLLSAHGDRDAYLSRAIDAEARVKELESRLEFDCSPSRIDDLQYALRCAGSVDLSNCDCHACQPITMENSRMILCATCGNKRCPHANDHRNTCTGSNDPGQPGSAYA